MPTNPVRAAARAIIPAVDALLAFIAGLVALGAAAAILVSLGPRQRVARLLGAAPKVTVGEAVALARGDRSVYVRVDGRIDSEAEFEDAEHRPLVLRRTRIQVLDEGGWRDLEVVNETVPFEIREGLEGIAIDGASLTDGLVVIPRESVGVIGDLGDRVADDVPDDLPARVVIELVSSVEHAIALGVPALDAGGAARLEPGRGRPLVLTTLEPAEARRIIGAATATRSRIIAALLVAAGLLILLGLAMLILPGDALAASPSPTAVTGSDTRSSGQGPGFVGAIGPALLAVVLIAGLAIGVTLAFVRLTGGQGRSSRDR
jgi:hypothetical protein